MQKLKQTRQKQNKQKTNNKPQRQNKQQQYNSSSRKLRDIYSRSSGRLDVLYLVAFLKGFVFLGCSFVWCVCLVFLSVCVYKQTTLVTTNNHKQTFDQKQQTYSSSSRNLRDIYSRSSGRLDVLYLCVYCCFFLKGFVVFVFVCFFCFCCFGLVCLSFCMYQRNNSSEHQNNKQPQRQKQTKQKCSSSSRNLRDVYARSSGGLDVFNHCKLHDYNHKSLIIHRHPLLWKGIPYYRRKSLTPLLYNEFLYYRMNSFAIEGNPLLYKEIPYYRRNCLTNNNN